MNVIKNIAKYKALILAIGMMTGLGIVAQPIIKTYVGYEKVCQLEKDNASDQADDSTENPNEAQISTLEAVAPTAQIHLSPVDVILENRPIVDTQVTKKAPDLAVFMSEKLLKVLFNIIIAPNAP